MTEGKTDEQYTCEHCWAQVLVKNITAHGAWHNRLGQAARDASYAAGMMRPLA